MFELHLPWHELVIRSAMLYGFVLFILRLANREGGTISPVDQVVLITVGDLVATAAVKNDDSLTAAFIAVATFVAIGWLVNIVAYRYKPVARALDGAPLVLVHNGEVKWDNMNKEKITMDELMQSVRLAGHASVSEIHVAMLEINGTISVISRPR
ncbi:MAG: hypothetical protein C0507_08530 [Cyanobacteria bacterium PR.3.49]|nr:hypothetical protein [Cyanobacteria bacterium PR.3.49]